MQKIRIKSLPDTDSFDIVRLVNVVTNHVFIIDKQVIVAVATVPELLAEAGRHISVLAWLTPQRAVIAAKIEAERGKTFLLLHGLSEKLHIRHSAIFSDCRKPDALAVDACTGRPRRCGWLDLVALKYTVMVDGVTDLIMMKSDCLDDFETIRVCTSYRIGGQETQQFPFDTAAEIEPVYTDFKGWNTDLTGIRKEADLPVEFKDYIKFMEDYLGVPISIISLGPDREATIER